MASFILFLALLLASAVCVATLRAAEWQWSVLDGESRAYLWIPSDCARARSRVRQSPNSDFLPNRRKPKAPDLVNEETATTGPVFSHIRCIV